MDKEITVPFGRLQKGAMTANINTEHLWMQDSIRSRIKAILKKNWQPSEAQVRKLAKDIFMAEYFGGEADYGEELFKLIEWHSSKEWKFEHLTKEDNLKVDGLNGMQTLILLRFREMSYRSLRLYERYPIFCALLKAMIIKIPVFSIRHHIFIHAEYAFNSIRKSKHPLGNEIITYLYEILSLQQKTVNSLHEFVRLVDYAERLKGDALLIQAEGSAIGHADTLFTYLKASIEKTMVLVALTHEIQNLDSLKTHRAKVNAFKTHMLIKVEDSYYVKMFMSIIDSENLNELNSFRNGLLHKKGVADLQPHAYIGMKALTLPFRKVYEVIYEQHSENTCLIMIALAILTDELVRKDPNDIDITGIPI